MIGDLWPSITIGSRCQAGGFGKSWAAQRAEEVKFHNRDRESRCCPRIALLGRPRWAAEWGRLAGVMPSQELCLGWSYVLAKVMPSQELCLRRSSVLAGVMFSQELCFRRTCDFAGRVHSQELCLGRSCTFAGGMSGQDLCLRRSYAFVGAMTLKRVLSS